MRCNERGEEEGEGATLGSSFRSLCDASIHAYFGRNLRGFNGAMISYQIPENELLD